MELLLLQRVQGQEVCGVGKAGGCGLIACQKEGCGVSSLTISSSVSLLLVPLESSVASIISRRRSLH